jgi:hypothetical protein
VFRACAVEGAGQGPNQLWEHRLAKQQPKLLGGEENDSDATGQEKIAINLRNKFNEVDIPGLTAKVVSRHNLAHTYLGYHTDKTQEKIGEWFVWLQSGLVRGISEELSTPGISRGIWRKLYAFPLFTVQNF